MLRKRFNVDYWLKNDYIRFIQPFAETVLSIFKAEFLIVIFALFKF